MMEKKARSRKQVETHLQMTHKFRKHVQLVAIDPELSERRNASDDFGQVTQVVLAHVESLQCRQTSHGFGKSGQLIFSQFEESQFGQPTKVGREEFEERVGEVERLEGE